MSVYNFLGISMGHILKPIVVMIHVYNAAMSGNTTPLNVGTLKAHCLPFDVLSALTGTLLITWGGCLNE